MEFPNIINSVDRNKKQRCAALASTATTTPTLTSMLARTLTLWPLATSTPMPERRPVFARAFYVWFVCGPLAYRCSPACVCACLCVCVHTCARLGNFCVFVYVCLCLAVHMLPFSLGHWDWRLFFVLFSFHLPCFVVVIRECEAVAATSTAGGYWTGRIGFMTIKAIKKHEEQQQQ